MELERRRYPQENDGAKNHWKGLIKHQAEIETEITKAEKIIKETRLKDLQSEYDRKILENLEKRKNELHNEQQEAKELNQKIKEFQNEKYQSKEQKKALQQHLFENYALKLEQKNKIEEQLKLEKQGFDDLILMQDQNYNQEKRSQQKLKAEQERFDYIRNKEIIEKKMEEKRRAKELERIEYNNLCDRYSRKEQLKDESYKNYYSNLAEKQRELQKMHEQVVISPKKQKEMHIDNFIEKHVEENNKLKKMESLQNEYKKKEELLLVASENRNKIMDRISTAETAKIEREERKQKRLDELRLYRNFLEEQKNLKLANQKNLQSILVTQINDSKKVNGTKFTSMNDQEKKINYCDLQAFKKADPTLFSLLPGWSPQIGGIPSKIEFGKISTPSNKSSPLTTQSVKTEPSKEYKGRDLQSAILFSPKLLQNMEKNLEEKNQLLKTIPKNEKDQYYFSNSRLRQELIYNQNKQNQFSTPPKSLREYLEIKGMDTIKRKNRSIFTDVGSKLMTP